MIMTRRSTMTLILVPFEAEVAAAVVVVVVVVTKRQVGHGTSSSPP